MTRKYLITALASVISAGTSFAAWTLVDDMNYTNQAALDAVWSPQPIDAADGAGGGAALDGDPADASNKVLKVVPGANTATTSAYNAFITRSLPAGKEIAGMGTVFFRVKVPTVTVGGTALRAIVDVVWGLGWRKPIADSNAPNPATEVVGSYNDFSVLARQEFDNSFDVFDLGNPSGTYQTILVDGLAVDVWYDIWYVCDHANNRFKVYAKGPGLGNGSQQVLIYPFANDNHPPTGWSNERSPSTEPLRSFLIYSSAGTSTEPKGLDPMYIDDIYVDNTGENLASPVGGASGSRLVNISTRGEVGTGDKILIGGFVVSGTSSKQVLIRAAGPSLGALGVSGTIADPVLNLFLATGGAAIATNTNWGDATNATAIGTTTDALGAFPFGSGSKDAAILITLAPGGYTAQVSGNAGTTGLALVEVYSVE